MTTVHRVRGGTTNKFMQVLNDEMILKLQPYLEERGGITIQEFLRAVVIPEWFKEHRNHEKASLSF